MTLVAIVLWFAVRLTLLKLLGMGDIEARWTHDLPDGESEVDDGNGADQGGDAA